MTVDPNSNVTRELDRRTSDGIVVSLVWRPIDNHVSVAVNDTKTGNAFQVEVRPGQRALDVFEHPYAYAALQAAGASQAARVVMGRQHGIRL
jgi:hypothetical protein